MSNRITKIVAVISAVSAALGIILCVAGAALNGSLAGALGRIGIHGGYDDNGYSYSVGDDCYDDFFGGDTEDFFDEFYMDGGDGGETSL